MENKLISRILFGVVILIFAVTFYFFYGMMKNGAPEDYDPGQLGVELIDEGKASNANYMEKGQEVYDQKIKTLEGNILNGVSFMQWMLYIAGGIMVIFLILGLVQTATSDIKKALPSLVFVVIAGLAFIYAYINSGSDTAGFDRLVAEEGQEKAGEIVSTTNFWVNGLFFVLIPGGIILLVDLVRGIIRGLAK